eukprot:COSAG01_NODE_2357_length_7839_cov_6.117571_11_plen_278_part_00
MITQSTPQPAAAQPRSASQGAQARGDRWWRLPPVPITSLIIVIVAIIIIIIIIIIIPSSSHPSTRPPATAPCTPPPPRLPGSAVLVSGPPRHTGWMDLPGRFRPQHLLTRSGVTSREISVDVDRFRDGNETPGVLADAPDRGGRVQCTACADRSVSLELASGGRPLLGQLPVFHLPPPAPSPPPRRTAHKREARPAGAARRGGGLPGKCPAKGGVDAVVTTRLTGVTSTLRPDGIHSRLLTHSTASPRLTTAAGSAVPCFWDYGTAAVLQRRDRITI